ncbi:Potassium voltage-gated channel subfamily G member 1, partial [Paramuricea clavata]
LNETCKHGGQLTIMYWHHCPYIMNETRGNVSGVFPNILKSIVKQCCHAVQEMRFNRSQPKKFDIALPVHIEKYGKTLFETLPFIAIAESLGIAVLKHSNVSSGKLMSSLLQAWPVLLFIILTACVAGIIMWFVERQSNSKQFSPSFPHGAFDGFWWAFVSMTSVGYGDKFPKSILGKLLGSCWIVIGMLFVTMFLGILTTTLMTLLMDGTFDIQHERITVLNGSVAHWLGIEHHATIKVMKKQEALYPPLIDYEVDAALVDINSLKDVVHKLQKEYNIRVSGILLKETFYGIVLREKADNLTACFQEYIEKYEHSIFSKMSEYSGTQKSKLNAAEDYFGSGGIFSISVYSMIALFVTCCVAGCVWELHKQRSLTVMKEESNVEYNSEELSRNGRLPLGTLSTSTDGFPSDCPCNLKDPFEEIDRFHTRQSDV